MLKTREKLRGSSKGTCKKPEKSLSYNVFKGNKSNEVE